MSHGYPNHKFSQFIDTGSSSSNQVNFSRSVSKSSMVDMLYNQRSDGGMLLEPRLQEYVRRIKFNKDNGVTDCITPEKEFQITPTDLRTLRSFFKGRSYQEAKKRADRKEKCAKKSRFPSSSQPADPRTPKLKRPKKNKKIPNMGMFAPDVDNTYYEGPVSQMDNVMDSRDLSEANVGGHSAYNTDNHRFSPRIDNKIDHGVSDFNKKDSMYAIIQDVNQNASHSHSSKTSRKRHKKMNNQILDYQMAESLKTYQGVNADEVDMDVYRMRGVPQRTQKSYGLRNPAEHYFDFIDPNFQNADNSVECWTRGGEPSRLSNKGLAREYKRDMM